MANQNYFCIIGVMDRLWFQQIILFSESTSSTLLVPKTLKQPQLIITESLSCPSSSSSSSTTSSLSFPTPPDVEISSALSLPSPPMAFQDHDSNNEEVEEEEEGNPNKDVKQKERPTRLNLEKSRGRSYSSSPTLSSTEKKRPRNGRRQHSRRFLQKSMSCRSQRELELEEVKGFMDLGFIFKKEHLSPRMIRIIPGLQRLELLCKTKQNNSSKFIESEVAVAEDEELGQEEGEGGNIRPYLSEAWLIKRPDSPLLNLRMPRESASADMKKHYLRSWARTVASIIQQES